MADATLTVRSEAEAAALQLELAGLFDSLEHEHGKTRDRIAALASSLKDSTSKQQERADQICEALASFLVVRADRLETADRAAGICAAMDRRTTAQRGFFRTAIDAATEALAALISGRLAAIKKMGDALCEFARVHKEIYADELQTVRCTHAEFSWSKCPEALETISTARDAEEEVARDVYQRDRRERFRLLRDRLPEILAAAECTQNQIDLVLANVPVIVDLWEESVTVWGQMLTADPPKLDKSSIKKLLNAKKSPLTTERLKQLGLKLTRDTRGSWKSIDSPVTVASVAA